MPLWRDERPLAELAQALDEVDATYVRHADLFQPSVPAAVVEDANRRLRARVDQDPLLAAVLGKDTGDEADGNAGDGAPRKSPKSGKGGKGSKGGKGTKSGKGGKDEPKKLQVNDLKRIWSSALADRMARLLAARIDRAVRQEPFRKAFGAVRVRPLGDDRVEPLVPIGDTAKRIDVAVTKSIAGLQLGVSLKGVGFPDTWYATETTDRRPGNYGKNFTRALYELNDEVALVHRNLPRSTMVCIYCPPLEACDDKAAFPKATPPRRAPSGFATLVDKLRERNGRSAEHDPSLFSRTDAAFVLLYATHDHAPADPIFGGIRRGVVRCVDVAEPAPFLGLPPLAATRSIDDVVRAILELRAPPTPGRPPAEHELAPDRPDPDPDPDPGSGEPPDAR